MRLYKGVLGVCLALGASCVLAEDSGYETNLLRNGRFVPADAKPDVIPDWVQNPGGWRRKEMPSFKGWPWSLFYLERECRSKRTYTLYQDSMAVEPDTWYVLSAWYKAKLRYKNSYGVLNLSAQAEVKGKMRWISEVLRGASEDWVKVKCYLFTGAHKKIRFQARFSGQGSCAIGNPNLHKLTDKDVTLPTLADDCQRDYSSNRILVDSGGNIAATGHRDAAHRRQEVSR